MKHQDDMIDEIGEMVEGVRDSAIAIGNQLEDSNAETRAMRENMDIVEQKFDSIAGKMKKTLDTNGM